MGKLTTRVKLSKQISLTNWDVTEDGVDINGTYNYISFPSPITSFPLEGTESGVTYNLYASENGSEYSLIYSGGTPVVQGYKHSSLESYIFYDGSQWALWFDGIYQWVNQNGKENILPFNNWQIYIAQGPAGNIEITDSSFKDISFLVKKQNLGGGKLIAKPFDPKDLINLQLWLKADAGVTTSTLTPSFIDQIVISGAGVSTSNGTYTRSTGGNTSFTKVGGNSEIYRDGSDWVLYDDDYGDETYINYDDLDPDSWGEYNAIGAPSAVNTTSSGTPYTGVTSWADQSGNSRNFTNSINNTKAPTFSNGALLFTSSATYNDINASILALPSSSLNFTTPYTLIALVRAGANNSVVFSKSNDNSKRRKYQISVNGGIVYSLESINGADTQISYNTGTGDDVSVKRLIVSQYSSNTSGLIRYNGNQVATSSTNVGIDQTNNASVFIGASPFQEGTGYNAEASTEMYVYEIIFYNRALSTVEIQKIETYLNKKYSIY
jgi:hypothetical protein